MEIIRVAAIGLIGGFVSILLRNSKPEFSMMIPAVVSFTVIGCVMPYISEIVGYLTEMADGIGINSAYMMTIVKIIGISYLVSISAELCKDAGENAIASKIELCGKIIILSMSIPIINRLLELVREIITA